MDKKRLEIIITSVLILVLVFAWINSIKIFLKKKAKYKATPPAAAQLAPLPASLQVASVTQEVEAGKDYSSYEEDDSDFVRSPFSGKLYGEEEPVDFKISGLIWDELNPQIIINDKISKVGDSIEGYIIEKIEKQKVTLFNGIRRIELNI